MAHAILRGANGRRHEVDFGDAEVTIEVYAGATTIEIVNEKKIFTVLRVTQMPISLVRVA